MKQQTDANQKTQKSESAPLITMSRAAKRFWLIYGLAILTIILTTIFCCNSNVSAEVTEKAYTAEDINELTQTLEERLGVDKGTGIQVSPYIQVYCSETGSSAMVVYTVSYKGRNYTVYGEAPSKYFTGLAELQTIANDLLTHGIVDETKEEPVLVTPTPTVVPETGLDEEDVIIERGDEW